MAYPYQQLDRPHMYYPGNESLVPDLFPNQPYEGMTGAGGGHYPGQYGPDYGELTLTPGLGRGGYGPGGAPTGGHYPGQYGPWSGQLPLETSMSGMGAMPDGGKLLKYAAVGLLAWVAYKQLKKAA